MNPIVNCLNPEDPTGSRNGSKDPKLNRDVICVIRIEGYDPKPRFFKFTNDLRAVPEEDGVSGALSFRNEAGKEQQNSEYAFQFHATAKTEN
jgi:hypothetical protein